MGHRNFRESIVYTEKLDSKIVDEELEEKIDWIFSDIADELGFNNSKSGRSSSERRDEHTVVYDKFHQRHV